MPERTGPKANVVERWEIRAPHPPRQIRIPRSGRQHPAEAHDRVQKPRHLEGGRFLISEVPLYFL